MMRNAKALRNQAMPFLLFGFMAAPSVLSQSDDVGKATGVEVGRGPLLFSIQPIDKKDDREEIHLVLDPQSHTAPKEFLRVQGAVKVLHRFDQDTLLLQRIRVLGRMPAGLFLLNLKRAEAQYLLSRKYTRLLSIEGRSILFLEVLKESDGAYSLDATDPEGRDASIRSHPEPRYHLYAYDLDHPDPLRQLWDKEVEKVLDVRAKGMICSVSAGSERALWLIPKNGKDIKKLAALDPSWVPSLMSCEFSPRLQRLALGLARKDSFFETRDLLVLDVATGKELFELARIPVRVSGASSFAPELAFTWLDEDRIRFSETTGASKGHFQWVDVNITTGKRLREHRYGPLGLRHVKPSRETLELRERPTRWAEGLFERTATRLYFKGEQEPVDPRNDIDIQGYAGITVSPDGKWGTFAHANEGQSLYLVDGTTRAVRRLTSGWRYDLNWLPEVK